MFMVKLEFIHEKFIPCHLCQCGHLTINRYLVFMYGSKNVIQSMIKMCNKANMVRRFYVLMMTHPLTIESKCVGVMKRVPTEIFP